MANLRAPHCACGFLSLVHHVSSAQKERISQHVHGNHTLSFWPSNKCEATVDCHADKSCLIIGVTAAFHAQNVKIVFVCEARSPIS